ncbi:MAG: CPBP family glutamic-type intramembrane protease [Myxococcota bacterium]
MVRSVFELAMVSLTALVFLAVPKPPGPVAPLAAFIVACLLVWGSYLLGEGRRRRVEWGLDPTHNLGSILAVTFVPVALLVAAGATWATMNDRPLLPRYLWLSMLLYPLWGFVQQWMVQCLFVDNLRKLAEVPRGWLVLIGAIGFGILHVADPLLWAATTAMGGVYVILFQRYRSLWPLGVLHGWLGSLFYPWVLDRNPMADLVDLVSPLI